MRDMIENNETEKVTRVEIIDENGRAFLMRDLASVKLSLQDDERTLKLFVTSKAFNTYVTTRCPYRDHNCESELKRY